MTNEEFFAQVGKIEGTSAAPGADIDVIQNLTDHIALPATHLEFLKVANGISIFGGYFRLFGCSTAATIDMVKWNSSDLWIFAWNKPLDEFWFFGETAWGDQYAYRRDELRKSAAPRVFFLEGITMNAEPIADDFDDFLEIEFLRNARRPYDSNLVAARHRCGNLEPLEHIAYIPSPLLTGEERVDSVSKMDAVASMIVNGDLSSQLAAQSQGRPIRKLQPYEDSNGRARIRVVWS